MRKAIVLIAVPLCSRGPSKLLVALDCNRRAGVTCVTCPQIGRFGVNRSGRCKSVLRPNRENPGYDGVARYDKSVALNSTARDPCLWQGEIHCQYLARESNILIAHVAVAWHRTSSPVKLNLIRC